MRVLSVDLAAKMSAYVLTEDGEVLAQGDSLGKSAAQFVRELVKVIGHYTPEIILIEDLPYGISRQAMTKPVTRLQGAIIISLPLETLLFINPDSWQKEYPGVGRGGGSTLERARTAAMHARELGYEAPDLVAAYAATLPEGAKVLKKHTNPLEKAMTDYVDAFLMNDFAQRHADRLLAVKDGSKFTGVQPGFI